MTFHCGRCRFCKNEGYWRHDELYHNRFCFSIYSLLWRFNFTVYGENHRDGQLCTDSAAVVFLVGKVRVKSALRLYRKTGGFSGGGK